MATNKSSTASMQWWPEDLDLNEVGGRVSAVVEHIRNRSRWRRDQDLLHATMYGGDTTAAGMVLDNSSMYSYAPSTVPRNVTRQAVETLKAKVAKHRPLPQVLTDRGNWKQQKRARKATQFLEGRFIKTKFFERHVPKWVGDAGIFGRGILRPFRRGSKIFVERVHPWEVLVDDWDARYGEPRSCYQVRTVDIGVAVAMFAADDEELARRIASAADGGSGDEWDWRGTIDSSVSRVRLVASYHLCDNEEAHEDDEDHECTGRQAISLAGGEALVVEPWKYLKFPFVVLNYLDPITGYWGTGLAEILEPWQMAITEQFEKVQEGHRMLGGGMIFAQKGSDVNPADFTNTSVPIIEYTGAAPTVETFPPVHPSVYQRERDLPQDALGEVGLTMTSVQGQKQPGVDSGIGIQTLDDIEDERHIIFGRAYEAGCVEMAEWFIELEREIAEEKGESAVSVPMKGGLLPLKWADVSLEDFQLRVFPTSILPQQLDQKLKFLNYLFDKQLIDRSMFMQLLGGPDAQMELDVETSDRLAIDEQIEAVLDAETAKALDDAMTQATPSAFVDLAWYQKRAQQRYNAARIQGCEEANLQGMRDIMSMCDAEISKMNPPAPPGPPPGPPGPQAPMGGAPQPGPPANLPIGNA